MSNLLYFLPAQVKAAIQLMAAGSAGVLQTYTVLLTFRLYCGWFPNINMYYQPFATVGTLFAAMLLRTSSRGVLLPILLYPVTFPVLIAGVGGTVALFQGQPNLDLARFWIALLVFFDAVFITLALWTFEPVMTE